MVNFITTQTNFKISFLPRASSSDKEKIKNNGENIANANIKLYLIFEHNL